MKNPLSILVISLLSLAICLIVVFVFLPAPSEVQTTKASSPAIPRQQPARTYADLPAAPPPPSSRPAPAPNQPQSVSQDATVTAQESKQQQMDTIAQAMSTYSEEGLPVLEPYLSNPDPEVRSYAVEAIKQLAVPAGADVLKQAAKNAQSTREQIEMLEAAEFLQYPRLPVSALKEMVETGKLKLPPSKPQTASPPAQNQ